MIIIGYVLMFAPTFRDLATTVWSRDEQGHGPIILAVVLWLAYRKHEELLALSARPALVSGSLCLLLGLCMFVLGRSQAVLLLEVGALIPISAALLLLIKGTAAVRLLWFPLFFMLFMVPLPATLVVAVTTPLKSAVSAVASSLLYQLGYPVGRSGVILTVGPYQLLVADACAGLNSMFTLEALGLLYMNIMNYKSAARNVLMAVMIIPISFAANIVRVCILVLVTYHFGDEAGQGFVHGFAGMVLFMVALTLILAFDRGLLSASRRFKGLLK
ncbi:exosortase B [Roseateles sp.]|uniref:exosortase B n=1 Tax=Roseateles sp. TaxID=1971397 RepID=UPI003BAB4FC0